MEEFSFISEQVAKDLQVAPSRVRNVINLLDGGNTIPFIARYRKEMTGELDEVRLRDIESRVQYLRNLARRKEEVLRLIEEQGKLDSELKQRVEKASRLREVEDLYRPYRQKKSTRAGRAREKGLEPLARHLLSGSAGPEREASRHVDGEKGINSIAEAMQGAADIIAETVADYPGSRDWLRNFIFKNGILSIQAKKENTGSVYEMYYGYREDINKIPSHRVLAINRGEREGYLRARLEVDEEKILAYLYRQWVKQDAPGAAVVAGAVRDGYRRLLLPAVERDLRAELTDMAESRALKVFAGNLRQLLLQPPVCNVVVLGVDPAYRTGCKWAVVNANGKLLEKGVVYPTPPQENTGEAEKVFRELISRYNVEVIAIGNGTASRETEQFVAGLINKIEHPVQYVIVNEAGASVYSASENAAREFPGLDVSERSAVSIARRLQDPLAELVKIDPKSLGVGQYQHDIPARRLEEALARVVESVVNYVGVDLNTASVELLRYVAGISQVVAENIVAWREEAGSFRNREELKKVPRLGPKTFEQAAGFLRLEGGSNPLDNTPIHPESYGVAQELLSMAGASPEEAGSEELNKKMQNMDLERVAVVTGCGIPTLRDIIDSLSRPGRDPREDLPPPAFRTEVLEIKDLREGMQLKGTVRNIVDFGVFVDIGVKVNGLVHISEMSERYVKHPMDIVAVGETYPVKVLAVDTEKGRISLSMRV